MEPPQEWKIAFDNEADERETGMGNPVGGDSTKCEICGEWKDYASEGMYFCFVCSGDPHYIEKKQKKQGGAKHLNGEPILHLCGKMLSSNPTLTGKKVSIVGKILSPNDDQSINFQTCDGQNIKINVGKDSTLLDLYNDSMHIEIRGVVQNDGSIQQESYQEFGDNFSLQAWNKFVVLTQQFSTLF